MTRLVIVSNRVASPKAAGIPGGLAIGVLSAMRSHARGGLWFGWSGETSEEECDPDITIRDGISFATMPLPRSLFDGYYNGFANGTLWPLFHDFLAGFRYHDEEHSAYEITNALFARKLAPLLRADDLIWVHDYHMIPLAEKLRALDVRQPLGYFLHIPFPHFEILRALPTFAEILRGLAAYDLVGFQTEIDRQNFLGAVQKVWGREAIDGSTVVMGERRVQTGVFPIGVDVEAVQQSALRASSSGTVQRMVQGLLGRRLIMGVDRLDYSKGLLERFEAYRHFLEDFSDERGKVTFLQIAPLGRQHIEAYAQMRESLERSSGQTNGRFADADWTPIRYLNRNYPHSTIMGFLRAAKACLVTPLRDGMNLVAKEFVAAQDADDPGMLILSNRAGAAYELTDALLVNPYDTKGIARALHAALAMPLAERKARHEKLIAALKKNDIHRWHTRFLGALRGRVREAQALESA